MMYIKRCGFAVTYVQVDGDSVSGICFVGYISHAHRAGFVLLPVGLCAIVGLVFLVQGCYCASTSFTVDDRYPVCLSKPCTMWQNVFLIR